MNTLIACILGLICGWAIAEFTDNNKPKSR